MKNGKHSEQELVAFVLPISGLKNGNYTFTFELDDNFFNHFPNSLIQRGKVAVKVLLEKREDVFDFDLQFAGEITMVCDRCLEDVVLPVDLEDKLLVKKSDFEETNAEVVFIPLESQEFNLAQHFFEAVHVSLPMTVTHDLNDEDCPIDIETFLEDETELDEEEGSVWDALKNLEIRKN